MALASGTNKQVRIKKESSFNVAPGDTGAVQLRRVTSDLGIAKNTYEAQEIVSDLQVTDFRHGTRRTEGTINGELSPGTYALLMAAAMRKDFVAGEDTGALTDVTAAAGPPGTFTRATGSYITDGLKIGDVGRWSGWTTTGTSNNARNYRITDLTATVMTVGTAATGATGEPEEVAAKASGDSVTFTVVGKKTWTPLTGHTNDSFAIEHWFSDVAQSELYRGCRVQSMAVALPASGLGTANFGVLGSGAIDRDTSAYYTSVTAAPSTGIVAAASGSLRINGADVAFVTAINFDYAGGMSVVEVVGSNFSPGVFPGRVRLSGTVTALFEDASLRDMFIDETEADLWIYLKLSSAADSDFLSFYFARIKLGAAGKDDGEGPIKMTVPFQALKRTSTGVAGEYEQTTLSIQDSTI